jgi:hypothetical protein
MLCPRERRTKPQKMAQVPIESPVETALSGSIPDFGQAFGRREVGATA